MTDCDPRIIQAAAAVNRGGVIICPTEGIYGFSCAASNHEAVARILKIKERSPAKGLVIIAASLEMVFKVADESALTGRSRELMAQYWPGHVTLILPSRAGLDELLTGSRRCAAVRLTPYPPLRTLCSLTGPLVSTSVNLSGSATLTSLKEIKEVFGDKVDYIVDLPCMGRHGSSAIIDGLSGKTLRPAS